MARQVPPPASSFVGVMRGNVTRAGAVAGSYYVQAARIHGTDELGPFQCLAAAGALVAGDRIVLAPVEGRVDDLIILGKL